jgi:cob(I)alamin adenosyltransferase
MSHYSRTGDDGTTGWLGKGRLAKDHLRIETLGTLDEASAALGTARSATCNVQTAAILLVAQKDLHQLMAEVSAAPEDAAQFHLDAQRIEWLEGQIDSIEWDMPTPGEFIVPGDTPAGAALDVARTAVRRAERRVVQLFRDGQVTNPALLQYLNRLSSLLFVLELAENKATGTGTTISGRNNTGS